MIDKILLDLVKQIKEIMISNNLTISVAESCTAGLLAACLTSVDKASHYFAYGFITYSNQAKIDLLNVSKQILDQFGAVSKETAEAMADSALHKAKSSFTVAITGIAGPSGGTSTIPIGTVWIAIASRTEGEGNCNVITKSYLSNFNPINDKIDNLDMRQTVRYLSCKKALQLVLQTIQETIHLN